MNTATRRPELESEDYVHPNSCLSADFGHLVLKICQTKKTFYLFMKNEEKQMFNQSCGASLPHSKVGEATPPLPHRSYTPM